MIVVDNASGDGSPDMVEAEFPAVRLVRNDDNMGFGRANNQGMALAKGAYFLLLNSDAELVDGSLADMLATMGAEPDIGVGHARLTLPDGRVQNSTYRFPSIRGAVLEEMGAHKLLSRDRAAQALLGAHSDHDVERDVDWVAGAFMLVTRGVFDITGGFDERFFMYGEDLEWCHRIRSHGWRIRFFPQVPVLHVDHASVDKSTLKEERLALCIRRERELYAEWNGRLHGQVFTWVLLAGGLARRAWYRLRGAAGDPRADAYRAMIPAVDANLRALREGLSEAA